IQFRQVSKRFALNRQVDRSLLDLFQRLVGRKQPKEYFWSLQDVTIDIFRGATVGLIGENGAGKSTFLKLVSGILTPTEGEIQVNGRVSALLELGAGFHPELTGRENIHLQSSLMGLHRREIDALVEPVIEFADLGPFIDTPVKHYSSGMYARLGFAIAIFVDPDLLLVDEVLAVGDENFQRRCLDVIHGMQSQNKTILIVSHSLHQVMTLCDHCIWMDDGRVVAFGPTTDVIRAYLASVNQAMAERLGEGNEVRRLAMAADRLLTSDEPPRRWGKGPIRIEGVSMFGADGRSRWSFEPHESIDVQIEYRASSALPTPIFSVLIHKMDGHYLWASNTLDHPVCAIEQPGAGTLTVEIPALALTAGRYHLSAAAYVKPDPPYWENPSDFHEQLYDFQVVSERAIHGDIYMPSKWRHQAPQAAERIPE
ncbi:MAG: ABC transporter ATP-binding protein, partial [Caldilineaceae bacterium]|nr:ABC transporter ATP-binding protein [Caldilineaceae bacterium]